MWKNVSIQNEEQAAVIVFNNFEGQNTDAVFQLLYAVFNNFAFNYSVQLQGSTTSYVAISCQSKKLGDIELVYALLRNAHSYISIYFWSIQLLWLDGLQYISSLCIQWVDLFRLEFYSVPNF